MNLNKGSTKLTPIGASGSHVATSTKSLVWGSTPMRVLSIHVLGQSIRGFASALNGSPACGQWDWIGPRNSRPSGPDTHL